MNALVIIILVAAPGCGDNISEPIPADAVDLPTCPELGCTVPQCHEQHCFCNAMACVPTGIPVPMVGGAQ